MTIHQVDPIALRQKLQKLGIGAGSKLSSTFAEDAVRDTTIHHAQKGLLIQDDDSPGWLMGLPELHAQDGRLQPQEGTCTLEPAELAYCLDAWARLWEAPA